MQLRPATLQDADLLLEWRNNPATRNASHNTTEIHREEHLAWLTKSLNNQNRQLFICEKNGLPVGAVRADFSAGVDALSWTVAPHARGCGVGKHMVALLAHRMAGPICAEVKSGNKASARIAEYAGMAFEQETNGMQYFTRAALT